jgi:hypothetical protein
MRNRIGIAAAVAFCTLIWTVACYGETAPHEYESWKSRKIGTTIRVEATDTAHPGVVRVETQKLVRIGDGDLTVEETSGSPGAKPSQRRILPDKPEPQPATAPAASTTRPDGVVAEGDEVMDVAGHSVHAHWVKRMPYPDTSMTMWTSVEVPGGFCKVQEVTDSKSEHRERTWTLVEIKEP